MRLLKLYAGGNEANRVIGLQIIIDEPVPSYVQEAARDVKIRLYESQGALLEAALYDALPAPVYNFLAATMLERMGPFLAMPHASLDDQPAPPLATPQPINKGRLKQLIEEHFSLEELRQVCFALDVNLEQLGGDGLGGKVMELVLFMERNGRLADLVAACREWRPKVAWE